MGEANKQLLSAIEASGVDAVYVEMGRMVCEHIGGYVVRVGRDEVLKDYESITKAKGPEAMIKSILRVSRRVMGEAGFAKAVKMLGEYALSGARDAGLTQEHISVFNEVIKVGAPLVAKRDLILDQLQAISRCALSDPVRLGELVLKLAREVLGDKVVDAMMDKAVAEGNIYYAVDNLKGASSALLEAQERQMQQLRARRTSRKREQKEEAGRVYL